MLYFPFFDTSANYSIVLAGLYEITSSSIWLLNRYSSRRITSTMNPLSNGDVPIVSRQSHPPAHPSSTQTIAAAKKLAVMPKTTTNPLKPSSSNSKLKHMKSPPTILLPHMRTQFITTKPNTTNHPNLQPHPPHQSPAPKVPSSATPTLPSPIPTSHSSLQNPA